MTRRAYKMVFRATRPEGDVRRTRTIYAEDYEEAETLAFRRGKMLLHGTELDWDVDVNCPADEVRE